MTIPITVEPTPNPNALKFVIDSVVKTEGKSTYDSIESCQHNPLAYQLFFNISAINQLHLFQNVITVSKSNNITWNEIEEKIKKCIAKFIASHNPSYSDPDQGNSPAIDRSGLSEELQKIEEILDKKIRPGLQGDGGDLQCLSYKNKILTVKYEGACGNCPSATMGTLEAIRYILQEDFDPDIEVYVESSTPFF